MNKLTKVGCSALCGSLAAISAANAGDLTVTGGADMTWVSISKAVTGNPIGIGSNFTMKGSGELDNGWTVDLTIAHANAGAYSAATVDVGLGGWGKLNFDQGSSANGVQAYDDKTPSAWEEPWGAGLATGVRPLISGVGPSSNIQYTFPVTHGTTLAVAYAPKMGNTDNGDKAGGGMTGTANVGEGYDIAINVNPSFGTEVLSGLNMFTAAHTAKVYDNGAIDDDKWQGTAGITYDLGPISIGLQKSAEYTGESSGTVAINTYTNTSFGIAFNVNDDLSISYGTAESRMAGYTHSSATPAARTILVDSVQAAYTMGGASMRVAHVNAENVLFSTSTSADQSAVIVSLGLAF